MIISTNLGFLWNFAFLSQQNKEVFFTLLAQCQQVFNRLVSAFRRRRRRPRLNTARFPNLPWSRSPHGLRLRPYIVLRFLFSLPIFLVEACNTVLASIIPVEGEVLVEADCSTNSRLWLGPGYVSGIRSNSSFRSNENWRSDGQGKKLYPSIAGGRSQCIFPA